MRIVKIRMVSVDENRAKAIKGTIERICKQSYLNYHLLEGKLKLNPDGFQLDANGARSCKICGDYSCCENSWYDKYGTKCMSCQEAINSNVIPADLNSEGFYSFFELED